MFMKKLSAILCAGVVLSSVIAFSPDAKAADAQMRDITTMELVHEMGIGINLGNTYESCGDWIVQWGDGTPESYETAWGSPVITKAMIQGYADEGFGVLRVPVAWSNMMEDDGTYTINPQYLAKVKQAVDWALEADLYVILNIHWDGGWWENFPTDKATCMKKYTRIWEQLCDAFGAYDDHLMFESLNEEGGWNSLWNQWSGSDAGKADSFGLLNEINQTFVDLVRASGGNNAERHLLIAGYNTDFKLTCDAMYQMPNDPASRCAVSVHYYTPALFAILEEDADWGKATPTWGSEADFSELEYQMDMMETNFIDKGIPVIIGEYGCPKKNKEPESVQLFLKSVAAEAVEHQLCPVLWDITDLHYDRAANKLIDQELKAAFNSISDSMAKPGTPTETTAPATTAAPTEETTHTTAASTTPAPTDIAYGDVNEDGSVDIVDVLLLNKNLLVGEPLTKQGIINADVDVDGKPTSADALAILKYSIDLITAFPVA